jgi:hypothetical protein
MITEYKQQEPTGNPDRQLSDCYPVTRHVNVVSDTENQSIAMSAYTMFPINLVKKPA